MNKITLETVKQVHNYIREKDYENLIQTIEVICNEPIHFNRQNRINVYCCAILSLLYDQVFTNPDFFCNEEILKMLDNISGGNINVFSNIFKGYGYGTINLYFTLRYSEMLLNNNELAFKTLHIIVRLLDNISLGDFLSEMLEISTDDRLLETITDILEDETLQVSSFTCSVTFFEKWLWLYLTTVIKKNRFDLLDRAVEIIYKGDYKKFLSKVYYSDNEFSFTKYVCLLFERYASELSKEQIGELFVSNDYVDKILSAYFLKITDTKPDFKNVLTDLSNEIFEIGVKFKNINSLMCSGIILSNNIDESIIQNMFEEETILYIGTSSYHLRHNSEWILNYVENHPECIISIDNFKRDKLNDCSNGLCMNNTQFKQLLKGRKLSMTDKVSENNCLNELIKGNARILPLVIAALEPDAQMCADLVDLCVKYNNIKALNIVNDIYKSLERKY